MENNRRETAIKEIWESEPDVLSWKTNKGSVELELHIKRQPILKHLCGYVGIPYDKSSDKEYQKLESFGFDVHGGITFSQLGDGGTFKEGFWWVGFDCAHLGDISPGSMLFSHSPSDTYKNIAFVKGQVEKLANQVIESMIIKSKIPPSGGRHEKQHPTPA